MIVRQNVSGERTELTPSTFYVRTRVHEYGGGAYIVHGSTVFFSNFHDQRLYRQDDGGEPRPITPEPETPAGTRYADARVTADGRLLICVRELHPPDGSEPVNELAVIPTDGSAPPRTIVSGHDFFAAPRISPDGRRLAWLTWDHPRMPWDGTELWVGDLAEDGTVHRCALRRRRSAGVDLPARVESGRAICTSSPIAPAGGTCTGSATMASRRWRPMAAEFGVAAVAVSAPPPTPSWTTGASRASIRVRASTIWRFCRPGEAPRTADLPVYVVCAFTCARAATHSCSSPARRPKPRR